MSTLSDTRPSPIAGVWYSGDPGTLALQIDHYIEDAHLPELEGELIAVIAPHAGYQYSGRTAGYAFRAVRGLAPRIVAVVSPYHNFHTAALLTSAHQAYKTPLGEVPVDQERLKQFLQLLQARGLTSVKALHQDREHSLEIELPFLQRALAQPFSLLPVMLRSRMAGQVETVGKALAEVLRGQPALMVASTDLSHFYPEDTANSLDQEILHQMELFSPQGVLEVEEQGRGFACGGAAVAAVLWAARELGATQVRVVHHSTSGDETQDTSSVVGYGAAVVLKQVE
ncbi:MAG: AmmeMemoRadiSam system protein B [Chloroflexi bacterium]|nr:AmmeMemoRadiSam system protein B [Chloroflexota bacterium]